MEENNHINGGAFQVARKLFNSELWLRKPSAWKVIWIYILGKVNHEARNGFERGEGFFNFNEELSKIGYGISLDSTKKFLQYGRGMKMLSTQRSTRGVRLKVLNYAKYQEMDNYTSTPRSTGRSTRRAPEKHSDTQELEELKNIMISSTKKSTLKKNMKNYNETDFSDSGERVIDADSGEEITKKPKTEGKNKVAIRIQHKFAELCKKNIGTTPIVSISTYKQSLFALNVGGLTETQIYDLFEEWFSLPDKKDEQLVSINQALSTHNINGYKVRNNVK